MLQLKERREKRDPLENDYTYDYNLDHTLGYTQKHPLTCNDYMTTVILEK